MTAHSSTSPAALPPSGWRGIARLALEGLATGVFVSVVLALAVLGVALRADAATFTPAVDNGRGALLLKATEDSPSVAAPLVATDVEIDVAGIVSRARVTQRFRNPTPAWREGVYVFPLPDNAAVDRLRMQVGERIIEGQIQERGVAKATYEAAKRSGRKASLVEQERPNLFTTSVAHLGPGEEVVVTIEYQQTLRYDSGAFSLRFPLAITPRYIPGDMIASNLVGTGTAAPTDAVDDADRITPPVVPPGAPVVNPVSISITLDAGFALTNLDSRYHDVTIDEQPGHRYRIELTEGMVPADRDFELTWTPDVGELPGAALFTEVRDDKTYALLMILPPSVKTSAPIAPREAVFIVDTSGSMNGVSIAQARESVLFALDRLRPGDRFNVIEFNSYTSSLYPAPVPVDEETIARARRFVAGLKANGGTEMKPALEKAFASPPAPGFVRQVVFVTDGAVGNENELLALIRSRAGDRRLFTVGIGPGPNAWFLRKAAQFGRGTATFVGDVTEVREKMTELYAKLESPALTEILATWPAKTDAYPRQIPDLYAGEPIVVAAEFSTPLATMSLVGRRGATGWGTLLPLSAGAPAQGIGALWARERISALSDALVGGATEDEIKPLIVATALDHHLVSKFTSLVAVDVTPTAPLGVTSVRTALPVNVPAGLDHAAIFGGLPQTATSSRLLLMAGAMLLAFAALLLWPLRLLPATRRIDALHAAAHAARRVC